LAKERFLSELASALDDGLLLKDNVSSVERPLAQFTLLDDNNLAKVVPIGVLLAAIKLFELGVSLPFPLLVDDLLLRTGRGTAGVKSFSLSFSISLFTFVMMYRKFILGS
jgi:hypothetical protein